MSKTTVLVLILSLFVVALQNAQAQDEEEVQRILRFACRMMEPARRCLSYMPDFVQRNIQEMFDAVGTSFEEVGKEVCNQGGEKREQVETFIKSRIASSSGNRKRRQRLSANQMRSGAAFLTCMTRAMNSPDPEEPEAQTSMQFPEREDEP